MRFENNGVWFLERKDSCEETPLEIIKGMLLQFRKSCKGFEQNDVCLIRKEVVLTFCWKCEQWRAVLKFFIFFLKMRR